jgi:hypothetical protein
MKPNIGQMMRQAQQLQSNMQKAQEQLGTLEVTGEAGGGMVKVVMNGRDDRELLEDMIAAACNDATRRIAETVKQRMADAMGGMQLPPGMKLPL